MSMKKPVTYVFLFVLMMCFCYGSGQTRTFVGEAWSVMYETHEGRMNGSYISYHPNGSIRAKGNFEHNGRKGAWSVYDSTGRLLLQRDYTNPFSYNQILFYGPTDTSGIAKSSYTSNLEYNPNGYIDWFRLTEPMVLWNKRIWRQLWPAGNEMLFEGDRLFNLMLDQRARGAIITYGDEDLHEADTLLRNADLYRLIGFRMVEDVVFDTVRSLSQSFIISLCPVVIDLETTDTLDLFWIYFPHFRKALAQQRVALPSKPHIKTFDDLFFYRSYCGQIYKEDNVYDRPIGAYITDKAAIMREAERIELELIELEHDFWLMLTEQSDTLRH